MQSTEIREKFLKYFEAQGHTRVKSSSLIPAADPTLLFTNAGMNQFKDCFLGLQDPGYKRATTSQKCVRAGGKHNDLENVGFTPRHHTFFEMLGNFSFGDYFKKDAIAFAWDLLKQFGFPKDRLRVTVFKDDDEAFDLWKAVGVRSDWIVRLGEKDNFWAMGDTGPCGPCTEIYFDMGEKYCKKPDCNPGCSCDTRFLEIWNNVFMQFNRDSSGKLTPLPKPSVDTGGGLERWAAVLQGKFSNYDSDLFTPILSAIGKRVKKEYGTKEEDSVSMRVIADHLRSGSFLMADGVIPNNEGRGYVLRRILRRAIRHGKKLGQDSPFLYELVNSVVGSLGAFYPELASQEKLVSVLMKEEEQRFHETLHRGIGLLEETIDRAKKIKQSTVSGDVAFRLYDSFGFPLDLIEVIAREHNLGVDLGIFNQLMEKQRAQSSWSKGNDGATLEQIGKSLSTVSGPSEFNRKTLSLKKAARFLFESTGKAVDKLSTGQEGFAFFEETPFYAEGGGQAGDRGTLSSGDTSAEVLDTFKHNNQILNRVKVTRGELKPGVEYLLQVNKIARARTAANHTATHLLHAALRQELGERVKQAGSLVDSSRLRFDFTFPSQVPEEKRRKIEALVNEKIQEGLNVKTEEKSYDDAIQSGAMAFFDEKYGDRVRVVTVGEGKPFSVELCGGTHLEENIGKIGVLKILSESSVASGVRRIEAITGEAVLEYYVQREQLMESKVEQLQNEIKRLNKENEKLQFKAAQAGGSAQTPDEGEVVNGIRLIYREVQDVKPNVLRSLVDQVRDKSKGPTIVCLATTEEQKVSMCVGLTKDLIEQWDASKIIQPLAKEVGGTGGGRKDFAQAGGTNPGGLNKVKEKLKEIVSGHA